MTHDDHAGVTGATEKHIAGDVKVLINTKLILARYYKVKGMESCKMQILS